MNAQAITFQPMHTKHIPLWEHWMQQPHVKKVWLIEGYETADYINQKIAGNGYDYPFVIYMGEQPIGYVQCSDLYAYRTKHPAPKGLFLHEDPGTFCMDIFIGEADFLDKGYGTHIVKAFVNYLRGHFHAKKIVIDPAADNGRAIHCYEKAGFVALRKAHDGVMDCLVMELSKH